VTPDDPQRMPRGTYPVELRCLCRGNGRYFSVKCPDVESHGRHADQDWHGDPPVYDEQHMRAAREYHEQVMAEVAERRRRAAGEAA
jgi:hypothetical protein